MFKKIPFPILGLFLSGLLISPFSYGQEKTTTSTTTVEQTTTQVPKKTTTHRKVRHVSKPAQPVEEQTTSVTSTTTTTEVKPPPPKEVVHKVYDEEMLKKMSNTLCTDGFKAYVGGDKKNICLSKATPPDIAYSCVWSKKGTQAYAPTPQGPCNLDYTEHRGGITVKKDNFAKNPPLSYGTEAQCCFRAAKGLEPVK
jgi:hypothetical protein